jgi:molybdopterin/thiamine biosynthesis adenylyltransferase
LRDYYDRQILLWGEETQKSLSSKKIAIIGSGGLGCSVALALSGSGIGEIDLVDFDKVELHNIHRQIGFRSCNIGEYKCEVLADLVRDRNPNIKVNSNSNDFEQYAKNCNDLDLIIDATDNLQSRSQIDKFAKEQKIPWIYGSVEEFKGFVALFVDKDFSSFPIIEATPRGIAAPMVMQVASFEANLALRYLCDLSVEQDTLHYLYYSDSGEFNLKKFKI